MGRYGWQNEDGVRGTRGRIVSTKTMCVELGCGWSRRGENANAIRVAARRHAAVKRHRVGIQTIVQRFYEIDG